MNFYYLGTAVLLRGTFQDSSGALADPTTVTVVVKLPDATTAVVTATKISTGVYEAAYIPVQEGLHGYRFTGAGAVAIAAEGSFIMGSSF